MEQFEMVMLNIKLDKVNVNYYSFQMYMFDKIINCKVCKMFFRGIFYQGYMCIKCGVGVYKECLEVIFFCKFIFFVDLDVFGVGLGFKMVVMQNYYGNLVFFGKFVLIFQMGDVFELLRGDFEFLWWEGCLV